MTIVSPNGRPQLGIDPVLIPVSNSEMRTYKDCRRKWWLAYYRGLRPKQKILVGPLPLGTRVHKALEEYYTNDRDAVQVYTELASVDRMNLLATEQDTKKFDGEAELGRIMVEGYLQWLEETGADAQLEVVSAEEKLSAQILGGKVEIRGKVDMRVKRRVDGVRLFFDHKTCAGFEQLTRTAHMDEQLMLYHMLETLKKDEPERCDGGVFNMLRKVKRSASARPPFYERLEVHFNKRTMESFWYRLHGTVQDMLATRAALDAGHDHRVAAYPTPSRDCTWKCEFFAVCPLIDDGSAAEELLEAHYETVDPYDRYENESKETS